MASLAFGGSELSKRPEAWLSQLHLGPRREADVYKY